MILYHGTNKKFDKFQINPELLQTNINNLMEGLGVYMTENESIAKSYGNIVYVINVNDRDITDFTKSRTIDYIIKRISDEISINLYHYINVQNIINGVLDGDLSVTKLYKEINDLLDSCETFYNDFENTETIFDTIKNIYFNLLKDVLKYNDKSLGEVYICIKNPENLKIVNVIDENITAKRLIKHRRE